MTPTRMNQAINELHRLRDKVFKRINTLSTSSLDDIMVASI